LCSKEHVELIPSALDVIGSAHNRYGREDHESEKAFETLLQSLKSADKGAARPFSMVLLLRESRFPTLDGLRLAAEKAFGTPFTDDKGSRHYVVQAALLTIVKAGPHTLSFLNQTRPYGDDPQEFERAWPRASEREAWARHTAWTAVDYVKGGADLKLEYPVLAKFCAEMLDVNCVGVYVPGEQTFIPNDGSLPEELQRMTGSRQLGVT
jgi:hypothetical protein